MEFVCVLLTLSYWALIIWIVLSYVVGFGRLSFDHPVRTVYTTLSRGIDPILAPIRRIVPPLRIGNAGLDLSPIVLFIAIIVLQGVVC